MEALRYGNSMYVSTVSGLFSPTKITVEPGNYSLVPYLDGFIFKKEDYDPVPSDCIHVLNDRDGDEGLSGTYWTGETKDASVLQIVNGHFSQYLSNNPRCGLVFERVYENDEDEDWRWDESCELCDSVDNSTWCGNCDKQVTQINEYNNIPVLFFLNTRHYKYKFENLTLEKKYEEHDIVAWDVNLRAKAKIGVAIMQNKFFNMMGDQMGLAVFSQTGTTGVGFANFDVWKYRDEYKKVLDDDKVFYPSNKSKLQYVQNGFLYVFWKK